MSNWKLGLKLMVIKLTFFQIFLSLFQIYAHLAKFWHHFKQTPEAVSKKLNSSFLQLQVK